MNQSMTSFPPKSLKIVLGFLMVLAGWRILAGPVPPVAEEITNVLSVFNMPAEPKDGRDPFFPASTHPYQTAVVPGARAADLNLDLLVLQGISGLPPNQLVIINKHTFAVGDDGEVSTSQGRIHLHCLEINAASAVIEVNGQRHELRYQVKQ